jgi:myo-inositol-1(or 4)-monophosphatase
VTSISEVADILDLDQILDQTCSLARSVGEIQKANLSGRNLGIATKSSGVDLVTEVDHYSEQYLITALRHTYPQHAILSEEQGQQIGHSEYLWIIDPLDGTTNYAQGLPIFSISIALQYRGQTVMGVVYAPVVDQIFTAIRGKGAFLNGKPIAVSKKTELGQCVLATGFPYDRATHPDNNVNYFAHFTPRVRGIRRMGSAAYDLANVASGALDGYWELNLSIWDVAAGALLVEEAGGKVVYLPKKRGVSLVAGNPAMCERILTEMAMVDAD